MKISLQIRDDKGFLIKDYSCDNTGKLLESDDVHNPTGYRLTFIPPKPEPVESEWAKLEDVVKQHTPGLQHILKTIINKIDELDRRCPAGDGK